MKKVIYFTELGFAMTMSRIKQKKKMREVEKESVVRG